MLATIMDNMTADNLPPECSANFFKRTPASGVCFIHENAYKQADGEKPESVNQHSLIQFSRR